MALRSGAMLFSVLCIVIWWWMAQRSTLAQITASPTPCRPALAYCAGTTLRRSVNDDVQAAIDNTQAFRYTGCTQNRMVTVAQLGRALDCGSSGCGFEPHRSPPRHPLRRSPLIIIRELGASVWHYPPISQSFARS